MSNVFEILIKLEFIKNYKMCAKFTILMSNVFVRSDCVTNEHILMKIIAFLGSQTSRGIIEYNSILSVIYIYSRCEVGFRGRGHELFGSTIGSTNNSKHSYELKQI